MRGKNFEKFLANIDVIKFAVSFNKALSDEDLAYLLNVQGIGISTISKFLYFFRCSYNGHKCLILDEVMNGICKLCTTMKTSDVTDTLELALQASGCDRASVVHKPRLLSDNGSSYVSGDLAEWLGDKKMGHVRGAPYHPQTQGKIERWHQTLKNRILLENYFFPNDLKNQIELFVDHYNHRRYHESINNLTPADVYFGRGQAILNQRERIKLKTMETRRLQYRKHAA